MCLIELFDAVSHPKNEIKLRMSTANGRGHHLIMAKDLNRD